MQQQSRYEAVQHSQQQKDEAEGAKEGILVSIDIEDAVEKHEDGIESDKPSTSGTVMPADSLEESFNSKTIISKGLRSCILQRRVLHQGEAFLTLKDDDKLTAFYTGLPNYTILMTTFRYTTKRLPES